MYWRKAVTNCCHHDIVLRCPLINEHVYSFLITFSRVSPVTDVPPQFTQEPEDTFVFETDASGQPTTLTISCGTSGEPTPTVTWFRSGEEVDSSLVLESGTLSIPNITEGESASRDGIPYYCTATNTLGTIRSKTVQVFYACKCVIPLAYRPRDYPILILQFLMASLPQIPL